MSPPNVVADTLDADSVFGADGEHLVVCGSGGLSLSLATELRYAGKSVVVVSDAASESDRERLAASGVELVEGSPLDESVLRQAGVASARCVAAVADDDVGNLKTGFAAQKVNPTVRVVLRLFNEEMGQKIQSLFHDCTILSASAIAAPFFVAAAVGHVSGRRIAVSGRALLISKMANRPDSAPEPGRIMIPLVRVDEDGDARFFPDSANVGDLILKDLGPLDEIDPVVFLGHASKEPKGLAARIADSALTVRTIFDRRFRMLLLAILAIVAVTVTVFVNAKHMALINGIYFTIVTMAGVGFGDYNLQNDPTWVKVYGVCFILVALIIIAIFTSFLIDALVGVRLARALGAVHRKMKNHIIVCGLGNVGFRVIERLKNADIPVIAVDRDENNRHFPSIRRQGIPVVVGDATLVETLHEAQVEAADCIIACTDDDIVDLEAVVNGRSLNPNLRLVVRLFDDEISKRVEHSFSIGFSRSMSSIAAPVFATEMVSHAVIASLSVGRRTRETLVIASMLIGPGSNLDGINVADLESGGLTRVLAITRMGDESEWMPFDSQRRLNAHDRIVVAATREDWRRLIG